MEDISIERIRETQSLGQKFNDMFKFEMVCFPTLFEKEENAPPVSKPWLLVISRNQKKAFRGLKTVIHLQRWFEFLENKPIIVLRQSKEKRKQSREKRNQHPICRRPTFMKPRDFWEIIKPLTRGSTRYFLTNLARKFTALLSNRSPNTS